MWPRIWSKALQLFLPASMIGLYLHVQYVAICLSLLSAASCSPRTDFNENSGLQPPSDCYRNIQACTRGLARDADYQRSRVRLIANATRHRLDPPWGLLQLAANLPRRKKQVLTEAEKQARKLAEARRANQRRGAGSPHSNSSISESEDGEWNEPRSGYASTPPHEALPDDRNRPPPLFGAINPKSQKQGVSKASYEQPYSSQLQSVLGQVHDAELSDDESTAQNPSHEGVPDTSQAQASAEAPSNSSTFTATMSNNKLSDGSSTSLSKPHLGLSGAGGYDNSSSTNASDSYGGANAIYNTNSANSAISEENGSAHGDNMTGLPRDGQQHEVSGEAKPSLANLVMRGIGGELLDCIELPLGYQEIDSQVDEFCKRLKKKDTRYPNHPSQTACRKAAKHVGTQIRRVYQECKAGMYKCLKSLWLTPVLPGITKLRSLMGIPQLGDLNLTAKFIKDAIESPQAGHVWKYPDVESNSCIFEHQYETLLGDEKRKVTKRLPHDEGLRRKKILGTLELLLLLSQRHLVETTIVGFLMSLFRMDRCKQQFKKNPRYSAPDGSTVDSRGLFQALLANVVSDAFVVDPKQCGTDEVLKTGTKTNVLCEHVGHGVKLRSVVKPILQLVAKDELEEALAKAANFAGDFQAAEVDWKDFEATQAIAKVHAAMSVSLHFAISSWKGKLTAWLGARKLLSPLLRKVFGEIATSLFELNGEARDFGMVISSVEREQDVSSAALLKYAEMEVTQLAAEARFYCQTGYKGLGNAVRSALKTATDSFARMKSTENRREGREGTGMSRPPSFFEVYASWNLAENTSVYPRRAPGLGARVQYPPSFVWLSSHWEKDGSALAAAGASTKKKVKKVVKRVTTKVKEYFADSKLLKKRWWGVLPDTLRRLKNGDTSAMSGAILLAVLFFVFSLSFSVVASVAIQLIGALCVLAVVLMLLDMFQSDASPQVSAVSDAP